MTSDLAQRYAGDANWLPCAYDRAADALVFAELPRERRRALVFLDPRFIAEAPRSPPIAAAELAADLPTGGGTPLHFIFHTGFCCSTLLARALDVPGVSMGVREPSVLVELANVWAERAQTEASVRALDVAMALLSRSATAGERQIIKPSNSANHIAAAMLDLRPDAKAILLYCDLGEFLRAIARRKLSGRVFVRQLFRQFGPTIPLSTRFSVADLLTQTDIQMAAHVWLMQMAYFEAMAEKFGPARVRTLSSRTLLARKAEALQRVGAFLGLEAAKTTWAAIAAGDVFVRHAKEKGLAYDAAARDAALSEAGAHYADEIEDAERWGRALAAQARAPLGLGDTLMSD